MPALAVAIMLTSTRSAWVGTCVAVVLLFSLKDFRLFAVLPIVAAILIAIARARITHRFVSIFDLQGSVEPRPRRDARAGARMIEAHPLVGVGPNQVEPTYERYREADAVKRPLRHLHNVPVRIAAERGLPALAIWLWFIVTAVTDLWKASAWRAGFSPRPDWPR